jgi:hypothetical protein
MRLLALAALAVSLSLTISSSTLRGAPNTGNALRPLAKVILRAPVRATKQRGCRLSEPIALGLATPGALLDVEFVSASTGWLLGNGRILATTDGGSHWTLQASSSTAQWSAMDFVDSTHGWVVGAAGLLVTSDGGRRWQRLPARCPAIRTVQFLTAKRGYAIAGGVAGGGGGLGSVVRAQYLGGREFHETTLLVTDDGGQSWQRVSTPAPPESVCFNSGERGWLGARGNIYATRDSGRHWSLSFEMPPRSWPASAGLTASVALRCAGAHGAWAEVIPPGVGMSQEPHIGLHNAGGRWKAIFAEQYFPHPGIAVSRGAPGSYPSAFSAISASTAAFIDWCPACESGPSTPIVIAEDGGSRLRRGENVDGLTDVSATSFISPREGWVAGVHDDFKLPCSSANCLPTTSFRLEHTTDYGHTWHTQYVSPGP